MPDFYEIDFLPVHREKSGDAIAIRYQIGNNWWVHVVDGGYTSTAPDLAKHIREYYGTDLINNVVVTHSDQDHAEGLAPILENFRVEILWMLRPWDYAEQLLPYFARYSSAQNLRDRLREDYPYIATLETTAKRRNIQMQEPFQGARIGPFIVLAPSPGRYFQLIIDSENTPQPSAQFGGILGSLLEAARPVICFMRAGWGAEKFSTEETSNENEMSIIQYALLNGDRIVLTGDAGRSAMNEAAAYAPAVGLNLPGVYRFQAPHHGGRRNVSTEILDYWLGPRLRERLPEGSERFTAMISSAKEDAEHPRKAVVRGLLHRGAFVATTEDGPFRIAKNAPARNWPPMKNVAYPDEQEN